ncbi:MAG: AsmA family protein [Rickettsiales bacterium]|jgi:uncharacterized protein involved in outer membrane biogenesis|nr:AsmA family protein [Rickettsiales bacterium]
MKLIGIAARIAAIAAAASFIGVAVILSEVDPNQHKDELASALSSALGREVGINGSLKWRILALEPGIEIEKITVANTPWGERKNFLTSDNVVAQLSLEHLLSKKLTVDTIVIRKPSLYLEISPEGEKNWKFGIHKKRGGAAEKKHAPDAGKNFAIDIKNLKIENARLSYSNRKTGKSEELELRSFRLSSPPEQPIFVDADVRYKGGRYTAHLRNVLTRDEDGATSLASAGKLDLNGATVAFNGKAGNFPEFSTAEATVLIDAEDMNSAFGNIAELPEMKRLVGEIELAATKGFVSLKKINLLYDTLNLTGSAEIAMGRKPNIKAELHIPFLDIPNLFYPEWEPAYLERVRTGAELEDETEWTQLPDPKAFRGVKMPVEELSLANANISLTIGEIKAMPEMPVANFKMKAALAEGRAAVSPVTFDYMGGKVRLDAIASNHDDTFNGDLTIRADGVNLGEIVDSTGYKGVFRGGNTNAEIALKGSGGDLSQFMASLSGYIKAYTTSKTEGYSVESILMANDIVSSAFKFLLVDVLNTVTRQKSETSQSSIHCAVVNLNIANGVATSNRGIAMQTDSANIIVDGRVDLGTESMDISMITVPTEGVRVSTNLAEMIKIEGSMARPKIIINRDGVINNVLKTGFTTAFAAAFTGGVTLVAAGIGILTRSWLANIQEDSNPCLTAFEGKGLRRPDEDDVEQVLIREEMSDKIEEEKDRLDGTTTRRIDRIKTRTAKDAAQKR